MKLYAGIDLHSNNSMVVIIDEQDRVMFEKRLPNELEHILLALASVNVARIFLKTIEVKFPSLWVR